MDPYKKLYVVSVFPCVMVPTVAPPLHRSSLSISKSYGSGMMAARIEVWGSVLRVWDVSSRPYKGIV